MRHAAHEAARRFLDGFAEDIVNTNDDDFENRLEEWTARGFPELAFYRGDRPRDRGEIIAEIRKAQRALDGDEQALAQATRDELPVLAGALRVAALEEIRPQSAAATSDVANPAIPVPAGGAQVFAPTAPPSQGIDIGDLAKSLPRIGARAATGIGTGVGVLFTPWNTQSQDHHFGPGGRTRVRIPPGDLDGPVEELDPETGEWRTTGEVGGVVFGAEGDEPRIVTGNRDQVRGAIFRGQEAPLPPLPGFAAPPTPDTTRETFPAEERSPDIEGFPADQGKPETEIFPVADETGPQVLVFPDMSQELDRFTILENRRGNERTRTHLETVRDWFNTQHPDWNHIGGGRDKEEGTEIPEIWIPGPGKVFLDEKGRGGDGRPGGKWADLTFKGPDGKLVHIQTVDFDKNGKPTDRELANAEAIRRATGATVYLIPKPPKKR